MSETLQAGLSSPDDTGRRDDRETRSESGDTAPRRGEPESRNDGEDGAPDPENIASDLKTDLEYGFEPGEVDLVPAFFNALEAAVERLSGNGPEA